MAKVINGWVEQELSPKMAEHFAVDTKAYIKGSCRVLFSRAEPHVKLGSKRIEFRQHLSISCADRYPTWDEIHDARYSLMGLGIHVAMFLPPSPEYVNIHPNCFHLFETTDRV